MAEHNKVFGGFSSNIEHALREYALGHLPAGMLAHLRAVNTEAMLLVDQHTGSIWKAAASLLLGPACLPTAPHADAVQNTLRDQAALHRNLLAGVAPEPCGS